MNLKITLKRPDDLTGKDYDQIAEMLINCFAEETGNLYVLGPRFSFPNYTAIRQSITDPRQRLTRLIDSARCQKRLLHMYSRGLKSTVMKPGAATYLAHDAETGHLAGIAVWELPDNLSMDEALGKTSAWFRLRRWCHSVYSWVMSYCDIIADREVYQYMKREIIYHDNVNKNYGDRLRYLTKEEVTDRDKIESLPYQRQDTVYLHLLAVDPMHQGKGAGYKLLQDTIDQIPNTPQPLFGGPTTGPQKFMLSATTAGLGLYKKVGFVSFAESNFVIDGYSIFKAKMVMTR